MYQWVDEIRNKPLQEVQERLFNDLIIILLLPIIVRPYVK